MYNLVHMTFLAQNQQNIKHANAHDEQSTFGNHSNMWDLPVNSNREILHEEYSTMLLPVMHLYVKNVRTCVDTFWTYKVHLYFLQMCIYGTYNNKNKQTQNNEVII